MSDRDDEVPRRHRLTLAFTVLVVASVGIWIGVWTSTPEVRGLGRRIAVRLKAPAGRPVALDRVAPILREAVVATEDERFYQHDGIDFIGVLRAFPYDLVHFSYAQGASTITEQVAKLLYLGGDDHSPWRKLEDAALALKLESRYTKDEILAAYLNSAYFGNNAYGVWAASERYFGVRPAELEPSQASLLAGLIQAPSAYNPYRHPELARARQVEVLRSLVAEGYLSNDEADTALRANLHLRGGLTLPTLRNVDFAPGPAFVWWELAFGGTVALLGAIALVASRLARFRIAHGLVALRLCSLALALLGAAAVVRSFRTA